MIVVSVKCLIIIAKRSLKIVEIIHAKKNLNPSLSTDKRKLNTKLIHPLTHSSWVEPISSSLGVTLKKNYNLRKKILWSR